MLAACVARGARPTVVRSPLASAAASPTFFRSPLASAAARLSSAAAAPASAASPLAYTTFFRSPLASASAAASLSSAAAAPASAASPHAYTVLQYEYDAADAAELAAKRTPLRPSHLAHAQRAASSGVLALGGAFGDAPMGGLLVFRTGDAAAVRAFAEADPYVTGGLVRRWSVRPWTVVIESAAPKLA